MASNVQVESLKGQIKQLQAAITNKKWQDASNVLNLLKKVAATEELLRATKAGVAVSKIRNCDNVAVSQLSKEVVTKWKGEVEESKKKKSGGASSAAAPSPAANGTAKSESPAPSLASKPKASASGSSTPSKVAPPAPIKPTIDTKPVVPAARKQSIGSTVPYSPVEGRTAKKDGVDTNLGDKVRDKCLEMMYDALVVGNGAPSDLVLSRAKAIEKVCYNKAGGISNDYRQKIRQLYLNAKDKNNPSLRQAIVSGDLAVEKFCTMSSTEMASEERKQANDLLDAQNLHNSLAAGEQEAETDAFQCGRCKQRKTRYRQAQTRSADEPMTTFVTCVYCGNRWKFS